MLVGGGEGGDVCMCPMSADSMAPQHRTLQLFASVQPIISGMSAHRLLMSEVALASGYW